VLNERDDYEIDMAKIEQEMAMLYNAEDHALNELQMSGLIGMCPKNEEPIVRKNYLYYIKDISACTCISVRYIYFLFFSRSI
jgi:hypothetical protein